MLAKKTLASLLIGTAVLVGCTSTTDTRSDNGGDTGGSGHPNAEDRRQCVIAEKELQRQTGQPTEDEIDAMCSS